MSDCHLFSPVTPTFPLCQSSFQTSLYFHCLVHKSPRILSVCSYHFLPPFVTLVFAVCHCPFHHQFDVIYAFLIIGIFLFLSFLSLSPSLPIFHFYLCATFFSSFVSLVSSVCMCVFVCLCLIGCALKLYKSSILRKLKRDLTVFVWQMGESMLVCKNTFHYLCDCVYMCVCVCVCDSTELRQNGEQKRKCSLKL